MNKPEEQSTQLERRARQLFDESVATLDARTLSHLNQARHTAIEAAHKQRVVMPRWLIPAGSMAALMLSAVVTFQYLKVYSHSDSRDTGTQTVTAMEDMEIIASNEELDLLQDVDFYEWLDTADAAESESG